MLPTRTAGKASHGNRWGLPVEWLRSLKPRRAALVNRSGAQVLSLGIAIPPSPDRRGLGA